MRILKQASGFSKKPDACYFWTAGYVQCDRRWRSMFPIAVIPELRNDSFVIFRKIAAIESVFGRSRADTHDRSFYIECTVID